MNRRPSRQSRPTTSPVVILAGLLVAILLIWPESVEAQCVQNQGLWFNASIASIGFSGGTQTMKSYAIGKWTNCGGMGSQFPNLLIGPSGVKNVEIVLINQHNPATCGQANSSTNKITLWATSETAGGQTYNCSRKDTLAHEIGHVLGLKNVTGCSGYMMAPASAPQPCGSQLCAAPRGNPKAAECSRVKERWDPPGDGDGGGGGGDDPPDPNPDDCPPLCSPIILDLRGDGFRFTNAKDGVDFDIARVDRLLRLAWTQHERDDVFLALDRDRNGWIDDGGELFGNFTDQPESSEPNGYDALALFDVREFGGNEDGKIDRHDQIYILLVVWHDRNHNGISEWRELYTLKEAGIDAIYLDYWRSSDRDEHGNELRYFGRVCLSARPDTLASWLASVYVPPVDDKGELSVLDPMRLRDGNVPAAVWSTECAGEIVQSTDVFFVSDGWSDRRWKQ